MIIGISGKKQNGKDTVGKIIQYLTDTGMYSAQRGLSYTEFLKIDDIREHKFEIKKFAEYPKNIVCMLIGCTREQLEDEEFKNTNLGKEWDKLVKPINMYGVEIDYEIIQHLTPRKLLQLVGTDCGREIIHPNIWVNALMSQWQPSDFAKLKMRRKGSTFPYNNFVESYPNWIITDVRFPNELKAVEDRGGFVIRINKESSQHHLETAYQHPSETALDDVKFKHTIDNNGTIEELIDKVSQILKIEGIN